jgi:ATP-dependent DNA ligase
LIELDTLPGIVGHPAGLQSRDTLAVPREADEPVVEDMDTARPDGFIAPCIATLAAKPPSGPGWVHEIKHDGYRLIVRRDGITVRLFTRRGHDWPER